MLFKTNALVDTHSGHELITNGHMGYKKTTLRSNSNPTVNSGTGTGFIDEEVVVNGEMIPDEVRLNSSEEQTSASSRESDYSPIWKYSCKVPNVTNNINSSETSGCEEAIYETVYPAEDYQNQDGDLAAVSSEVSEGFTLESSQLVSDEDSPPPLPPRTKSLLKSLTDSGHRPLERSMAVQLGLPPPFPTTVKKRPMPLPATVGNGQSDNLVATGASGKILNGVNEPSVRPKAAHLSASSQSSCDSESSGASFGEAKRTQYSLEGSFSYDIVDLDDVLQVSEVLHNQIDVDSQCQVAKSSTQGIHSSLQSSSCASMDSEPSEEMIRPSMLQSTPDDVTNVIATHEDVCFSDTATCSTVAPLATPEQDSSLLQETTSTDTLLENSEETTEPAFNKSKESCLTRGSDNVCVDSDSVICDTDISCAESFNSHVHSFPQALDNQSDSVSSPVNVTDENVVLFSAQEGSSIAQDLVDEATDQTVLYPSNVNDNDEHSEETAHVVTDFNIQSDVLNDSLQISSSNSESFSPAGGSITCSVSSQGGEDGRRGSESTCMVISTESSSSNSVFASPTAEASDLNVELMVSESFAFDMNIPSDASKESQTVIQDSQELSVRPRKEQTTQGPSTVNDEDIPPAVPPHKPHHRLLKALVHPPLCPPTPTHHAKPQPPERTTSEKREREVSTICKEEGQEKDEKSGSSHPKLSRQPSLRDWLKRYPKVEVAFDEPLPASE